MNGFAPSGTESNCSEDAVACSRFFANVTGQNGFPPVYVVPINTGATGVMTQIPNSSLPPTSPSEYAAKAVGGSDQTFDEDSLAFEFGVLGSTGWKISGNGTNTADARNGTNTWSSGISEWHNTADARNGTNTWSSGRLRAVLPEHCLWCFLFRGSVGAAVIGRSKQTRGFFGLVQGVTGGLE